MRPSLRTPVLSLLVIGSLLGLGPLASSAVAAQRAGEATYESPTFGYTLTYDPDDWEVTEETTDESGPYDLLALNNGTSFVLLIGDSSYAEGELDDCIDTEIDFLLQQDNSADPEPLDEPDAAGADDDRAWTTYTYVFEDENGRETDITRYIECRDLGDGVTLIIYQDVAGRRYEREIEAREDLLDGLEIPDSRQDDADDRDQTDADAETYESPHNGYTVTYDPETWEITRQDDDPDDDYDTVEFGNGTSTVSFTGDADYGGKENVACVEAYAFLLEVTFNVEDIAPLDEPGADGEDDDRAWGTYAYVLTDDGDETDTIVYIECRSLDGVTLVTQHTAPAADYEGEVAAREELVDGFEAGEDSGQGNDERGNDDDRGNQDDSGDGEEGGNGGDSGGSNQGGGGATDAVVYESPQYGYTLTYDPDQWDVAQEDDDEDDSYDFVSLTDGVSIVSLTGDPDYSARTFDTCLADYIGLLERDPQVDDPEPVEDRGAEGEDDDRAWATYSYTFTNDDGDEFDWIRYYECRFLGDGGVLGDGLTLVVIHEAAPEDYDAEVEARDDLLAGFDAP